MPEDHAVLLNYACLVNGHPRPTIQWTMRVPRTHWARSLSGVQMITRSTRSSRAAAIAAAASASSASNSTIGHTTMPAADSTSSSSGNCANRSGSMPSPGLVTWPQFVAKGFDHVIGCNRDVRWHQPFIMPRTEARTPRTAETSRPFESRADGIAW